MHRVWVLGRRERRFACGPCLAIPWRRRRWRRRGEVVDSVGSRWYVVRHEGKPRESGHGFASLPRRLLPWAEGGWEDSVVLGPGPGGQTRATDLRRKVGGGGGSRSGVARPGVMGKVPKGMAASQRATMWDGQTMGERQGSHDAARLETLLGWWKSGSVDEQADQGPWGGRRPMAARPARGRSQVGGGPRLWKPWLLPRRRSSGRTMRHPPHPPHPPRPLHPLRAHLHHDTVPRARRQSPLRAPAAS